MVVVKVRPPGLATERGWRMKPGDAVKVEWAHDEWVQVEVEQDGTVVFSSARDDADGA